jgi:hypothetical protein
MPSHAKGDRITQVSYGTGTIVDVNAQYTVIDFDEHGQRTFVTTLVRLEPSETPAPPPRPTGRGKKKTVKAVKAAVAPPEQS